MIVPFESHCDRRVRGTSIRKGQTLYAIRKRGLYFIWAYSNLEMAQSIDRDVEIGDDTDRAANWRRSLDQLIPTDRTL